MIWDELLRFRDVLINDFIYCNVPTLNNCRIVEIHNILEPRMKGHISTAALIPFGGLLTVTAMTPLPIISIMELIIDNTPEQ